MRRSPLNVLLDKFLAHLNAYEMGSAPQNLYQPAQYILNLGGKRLRPLLLLTAGELYGKPPEQLLNAALAIEVFHNFSLVHDDIMDQAPLRRNQATVHHKWNLNTAILSGDAMLVEAYRLLVSNASPVQLPDALQAFNSMARQLCEGQQLDMDFESLERVGRELYLHMIGGKTSVLIGCALQLGAILANASALQANALYQFGFELGLAFQIMDDYLDAFGDSALLGKQAGGDIIANKQSFLRVLANEIPECQPKIKHAFTLSVAQGRVDAVMELYRDFKLNEKTVQIANEHLNSALEYLTQASPQGIPDPLLQELAHKLVARPF